MKNNKRELLNKISGFMQIDRFVVCEPGERLNSIYRQANFKNSGMALCGYLSPGETLDSFKLRYFYMIDGRSKL